MNEERALLSRLGRILAALLGTTLAGVFGYHWIEGWSLFDSFYMTVITLATVGYGEVHALSPAGRAFTIALIMFGIGILTYALSMITAFIVEGELKDVLRRRRMEAKIAKLSDHFVVCGAGHTGRTIYEELQKTGRQAVVIDKNPERVAQLQEKGVLALMGDATDDEMLLAAGVLRARGLFGALPTDPDNVYVSISARGLNPKLRIVSKQQGKNVGEKLRRSGADAAIDPGYIGGLRMASEMIRPAVVGFLDSMMRSQGKVMRIEEVAVPEGSPMHGKPLDSVKGSQGQAALVLALRAVGRDHDYELNPPPGRLLQAGDVLVAMGSKEHLKELEDKIRN